MRPATSLLLIILLLVPLVFGSAPGGAMFSPVAAEQPRAVPPVNVALTGVSHERGSPVEESAAMPRGSSTADHGDAGLIRQTDCESTEACSSCTLCQACQACHPAALLDGITQRFAFLSPQVPPLHLVAIFSGIDRSPHLKPPIL